MLPANDNAPPAPRPVPMVPIIGVIVEDGRVLFHDAPAPLFPALLFPNDPREP